MHVNAYCITGYSKLVPKQTCIHKFNLFYITDLLLIHTTFRGTAPSSGPYESQSPYESHTECPYESQGFCDKCSMYF